MHAKPGDWLVVERPCMDLPPLRAQILEVHSADGSPPYLVRWLEDDHTSTVFPGADVRIEPAGEMIR